MSQITSKVRVVSSESNGNNTEHTLEMSDGKIFKGKSAEVAAEMKDTYGNTTAISNFSRAVPKSIQESWSAD